MCFGLAGIKKIIMSCPKGKLGIGGIGNYGECLAGKANMDYMVFGGNGKWPWENWEGKLNHAHSNLTVHELSNLHYFYSSSSTYENLTFSKSFIPSIWLIHNPTICCLQFIYAYFMEGIVSQWIRTQVLELNFFVQVLTPPWTNSAFSGKCLPWAYFLIVKNR